MRTVDLLDRPIAFQRVFVTFTKSIAASLFLSQAVYWSKRVKRDEPWFYKSIQEWEEETGLTRREQELARRILRSLEILEEEKRGVPCRLWYRLNIEKLEEYLGIIHKTESKKYNFQFFADIWGPCLKRIGAGAFKRAVRYGAYAEKLDYKQIFIREKGQCHICKKPISLPPGKRAQSLQFEHVMPLYEDGKHVYENVKCAHAFCNSRKGRSNPSLDDTDKLETSLDDTDKLACQSPPSLPVNHRQTSISTETTHRVQHEINLGAAAPRSNGSASLVAPDGASSSADADLAENMDDEAYQFYLFSNEVQSYWNFAFRELSGGTYKPGKKDSSSIKSFFQVWGKQHTAMDVVYAQVNAWMKSEAKLPKPGAFDTLWKSRRALHSLTKFLDTFPEIKTEIGWNSPDEDKMKSYLADSIKMVFKVRDRC